MVTPEQGEDRRVQHLRVAVLRVGVVAVFSVLAFSFWSFQVAQHVRFLELAENNHQRALALRAPRGVLFDRDGRVLVENRYALHISLVREQTKDLDRSIRLLADTTQVDEQELRDILEHHRDEPEYRPIVMIEDASLAQIAAVAARKRELPDIVVEEIPTRHYPIEQVAAHSFGYVGEITDAQLANAGFGGLRSGAIVGQSGLEQVYNHQLMGTDGIRRVVVNSVGREIETIGEIQAQEGQRLQLALDYDLQAAAEEGFKANGFFGSAVVLDPRSGEVLALVSLPAFNPNAFASGIDQPTWDLWNRDALKPLQNRPIQGRYSPGSLFKVVVAIAALEEGIASPDFKVACTGGAYFYGRRFRCHLRGGHGVISMRRAIEKSCNVYFYTLGNMVGIDRLHHWATALGLGEKTGIDLPSEVQGIMPSTAWKLATTGEKWYAGETISVSIGQGQVSVTPISLAVMMATLANGGTRYVPRLLRAIDSGGGWEPASVSPPKAVVPFAPETLEVLRDGLWRVVNAAGTGGRARIPGRDVVGKTGTAQVISRQGRQAAGESTEKDLRDHGWFIFSAPRDDPQIAGVVLAEHSEHGYLAAPIARHILQTYFAKQEGRSLPAYPLPPPPADTEASVEETVN